MKLKSTTNKHRSAERLAYLEKEFEEMSKPCTSYQEFLEWQIYYLEELEELRYQHDQI